MPSRIGVLPPRARLSGAHPTPEHTNGGHSPRPIHPRRHGAGMRPAAPVPSHSSGEAGLGPPPPPPPRLRAGPPARPPPQDPGPAPRCAQPYMVRALRGPPTPPPSGPPHSPAAVPGSPAGSPQPAAGFQLLPGGRREFLRRGPPPLPPHLPLIPGRRRPRGCARTPQRWRRARHPHGGDGAPHPAAAGTGRGAPPGPPRRGLAAAGERPPVRCGAGEAESAFPPGPAATSRVERGPACPRSSEGPAPDARRGPPARSRTAPLPRC